MALTERYRIRHLGWNVKHFYAWYRREGRRPELQLGKQRTKREQIEPGPEVSPQIKLFYQPVIKKRNLHDV
jgi:hypothetical protein